MKKFLFLLFLLLAPFPTFGEDGDSLRDFDDDDFLSAKIEPKESNELLGWSLFKTKDDEDRYIINFNNVSMIEYIRFVSRISGTNFQFDEAALNFPITIVSEEPLSVQNILSTMIQTLRARGFSLLEQDNYLLITSSPNIQQIPKIVTESDKNERAPIVTRIFRIQNANLNTLSTLLRPMMSQGAMIDVSNETRQLIVTDIITNVDKIAILIEKLDSPHSPLEIEVFRPRHLSAKKLIVLAQEIVLPFSEGNPLIMVPQEESNAIYIVSTPNLIERSIEIMEDLDVSPGNIQGGPIGDRIFLYRLENKSADELMETLENIAKELKGTGSQSIKLIKALENVKWIKESNSLLFIADEDTEKKIQDILTTLDTYSDTKNYLIYKIEKGGVEQIEDSLDLLAKNLRKNPAQKELVDAIESMRYIKETHSLIFTGSDESLKKIQELLPNLDVAISQYSPSSHYWIYTPQYLTGRELKEALEDIEDNLSSAGLSDQSLLQAIGSLKWVASTNTLLFTGTPDALDHIQSIIKLIDIPSGSPSRIFLYQPKYVSHTQIEDALDELADKLDTKNLTDRNLAAAIDNMTWIAESQNFLFKSDPATIDKIAEFLKDIDNPEEAQAIASAYFLYNLQYGRGEDILDQLDKIAKSLPLRDPSQKGIVDVINGITFLRETNSLLLTGTQKGVDSVKTLISQFDVKGSTPSALEKTSFYIYKPIYLTPGELDEALKDTAEELRRSGLLDPTLLQSIDTLQVVELTGSMIFTGTKESLEKTKEIIASVDTKEAKGKGLSELAGHTFFIYKVRYTSPAQLLTLLNNVAVNLQKENASANQELIKVIQSAKEISETNSILFTGLPSILQKLEGIIKQLDTPSSSDTGAGADLPREAGSYVVYRPVNVNGPELIEMMKEFIENLVNSGVHEGELFETIENLKYITRTGYILISGSMSAVEKTQELLQKFDVPQEGKDGVTSLSQLQTSFLIYKLNYHQGLELQETLKSVGQELSASSPESHQKLLQAINSIQWIKMTNSILATGTPEVLTQLKELISNIDVPLRQVFIEVLIIKTTLSNNQSFGLQWGGKVQYLNRFAGSTSSFPAASGASSQANRALQQPLIDVNATRPPLATDIGAPSQNAGGIDLGVIGDLILHKGKSFISLASLVNALQQDNESSIVMNPKIIAQDNQQATIFVGENIPFTGSNVNTISGGATQTQANIEYRDVGVNLTITPILGRNDMITLDISNEITNQIENTTASSADLTGLQTSRTSLNARVHVPNKHFVALSGMIRDDKTRFKSGVPCLGGLPVVGALFSQNNRFDSRDNVIFFLRPVIIDSVEEYDKITQNQEELFKEQAIKQQLKEDVDDGIDWVKGQIE